MSHAWVGLIFEGRFWDPRKSTWKAYSSIPVTCKSLRMYLKIFEPYSWGQQSLKDYPSLIVSIDSRIGWGYNTSKVCILFSNNKVKDNKNSFSKYWYYLHIAVMSDFLGKFGFLTQNDFHLFKGRPRIFPYQSHNTCLLQRSLGGRGTTSRFHLSNTQLNIWYCLLNQQLKYLVKLRACVRVVSYLTLWTYGVIWIKPCSD